MKSRHPIIKIALVLLSTLLLLLLWGTAVAQSNSDIDKAIVRFGSDVTIAKQ